MFDVYVKNGFGGRDYRVYAHVIGNIFPLDSFMTHSRTFKDNLFFIRFFFPHIKEDPGSM